MAARSARDAAMAIFGQVGQQDLQPGRRVFSRRGDVEDGHTGYLRSMCVLAWDHILRDREIEFGQNSDCWVEMLDADPDTFFDPDKVTVTSARANIDRGVVYTPPGLRLHPDRVGDGEHREDGVITGTSDRYVFVRYAGDTGSKATAPEDLEWLR